MGTIEHIGLIEDEPRRGDDMYRLAHWRVQSALEWRQKRAIGDVAWRRWINIYTGKHYSDDYQDVDDPTADNPRKNITLNIGQSTVQDYLPFLVRQNPRWVFRPKSELGVVRAPLAQAAMDHFWQELQFQQVFKSAILDMLVVGHCIGATGYTLEIDEAVKPKTQGVISYEEMVVKDAPVFRRVDPFMFIGDPSAKDADMIRNGRWCAELTLIPLQDLIANSSFSPSVIKKIKDGTYSPETVESYTHKRKTSALEWLDLDEVSESGQRLVPCFHFWDKKWQTYSFYASNVLPPLIHEPWKYPYMDGFPYVMGKFIQLHNEPYGMSLIGVMEDQLYELDRIATAEFEHRRKYSKRKFLILKNSLAPSDREKLFSGHDEDIEVKVPGEMAIKVLDAPALPQDNYRVQQIIMEWLRELSGRDQLMSGGNLPSRTSAREIEARQSIVNLKARERIVRVDEFAREVGIQIWKHLQANMTTPRVVQVLGQDGAYIWQTVMPEQLKEDFDLELISSSKEEFDPVQERAQRTQIWQILAQNAEGLMQQGYMINWPALTRFLLESFERKDTNDLVIPIPQPDPAAAAQGEQVPVEGEGGTNETIHRDSVNPRSATMGAMLGGLQ